MPKCRQYPPFVLDEYAKDEISFVGVVDEETQRNDLDIGTVNSSRMVGYREPNRWRQIALLLDDDGDLEWRAKGAARLT